MGKNKRKLKATKWTALIQVSVAIFSFVSGLGDTMSEAMVQIGWCVSGDAICVLNHYGVIFALFLVSALVYDLSKKCSVFLKIHEFFAVPNKKSLHVFSGSLRKNIFTLKFKYVEWRYLFKKTDAHITIPSMLRVAIMENLEWREPKTTSPVFIKRFKSYEINFIRIDPENNKFYIITNSDKNPEFEIGEYSFDIGSSINISDPQSVEKSFPLFWKELF